MGYSGPLGYFFPDTDPALVLLFVLLAFMAAYLLGSINTAILVSKLMYHDDIRNYGSGNAGFTNIMRIYGKKAAVITFVGDIAKTLVAVMIGWCVFGYFGAYITGFACFIGHIFPIFYRFRGGKGVLCFATILFMLDWRIFCILFALFIALVVSTKFISLGSVIGSMAYPLFLYKMNDTGLATLNMIAMLFAAIIVLKHIPNIKRIMNGTESKFSFKKSKPTAEAAADSTQCKNKPE